MNCFNVTTLTSFIYSLLELENLGFNFFEVNLIPEIRFIRQGVHNLMTPSQDYILSIQVSTSAYLLHYKKAFASYSIFPPRNLRWLLLKSSTDLSVKGRFPRSKLPFCSTKRVFLFTESVYVFPVQKN